VLYIYADPSTHLGSFFGNAIADWSGVVVVVLATKHMYEKGSAESREPPKKPFNRLLCFLEEHSLTIFLAVTGIGWTVLFKSMDANSKWGQVVGNIVSEWTQIIGLVLLTKRLLEPGSKESKH
jgi:putative Mn2+ efflux pump MntP